MDKPVTPHFDRIWLIKTNIRRSLSKNYTLTVTPDSSSSEYQSTDSSSPKRQSLFSRLFRRSGKQKNRQIDTFSAQFPPTEWFNSRAVHLHNVGTQTSEKVGRRSQQVVLIQNKYFKTVFWNYRTCLWPAFYPTQLFTTAPRLVNSHRLCPGTAETHLVNPRSWSGLEIVRRFVVTRPTTPTTLAAYLGPSIQ